MEHDLKVPEFFFQLKELPFLRHAVIAGGFVRDQVIGIKPSDCDIFAPYTSQRAFNEEFWTKIKENYKIEITTDAVAGDYSEHQFIKYDFTYDGIEYDLMGVRINVDGFSNTLVERFPFGNQQAYYDGKKFRTTDAFDADVDKHTMTLKNCDSVTQLPTLMEKFKKVSDKYRKEVGLRMQFASEYSLQRITGDDWL